MLTSDTMVSFFYFFLSVTTAFLALHTRNVSVRLALFTLIAYWTSQCLRLLSTVSGSPDFVNLYGMTVIMFTLHMGCCLLLEFHQLPGKGINFERAMAACHMLFNGRYIGTSREVPGLRRHIQHRRLSKALGGWPTANSPRWTFVMDRILTLIIIFIAKQAIKELLFSSHQYLFSPLRSSDILPSKQILFRRLSNISPRELVIRAGLVLYHNWFSWSEYTFWYNTLAMFFVGAGLSTPNDWPSLFGSVFQAYSLRRYWSRFWHRLAYRTYVGYSKLAAKILRIGPDSALYSVWISLFVFLLSGAVHAVVLASSGYVCGYWEEIHWFLLNFAGILVEQVVCHMAGEVMTNSRYAKVIGFAWVFMFQFWSLPRVQFPKSSLRCIPL